jgi:hypothetical protein
MIDYHKMKIEEIFARTRALTNMRVQILTFFGTVSLTTLGFALGNQKAGLLFIAAGISMLTVVADSFARRHQGALYYRGLQLERKYTPEGEHALLDTYVAVAAGPGFSARLLAIADLRDQGTRVLALRRTRSSIFGFWLPLLITLIEIVAGTLLWLIKGWSLF